MNEEQQTTKVTAMPVRTNYLIPLSIVIAGALIGAGLYFSGSATSSTVQANKAAVATPQPAVEQGSPEKVNPVTATDHIKGSPDAAVKIVEYSDFECPFCKRFHDTMNQIMEQYGNSDDVAWVYRHFPLDQLHSKARPVAVASECANEQGGNDTFWKFTDRYFALTKSNNQTDIQTVIPQIVNELGLNTTAFQSCFESGKYDDHIQADVQNAIDTGGRGTPWSIVIAPNGKTFPLNGALPLEAVKQLIELAKKEQ
ncbi:thioredoxin domain-containing protein [Candidatus Nomurabacteria bacterium]|nr:thioredoxin domain-containing protein [Candidatus Nomurabacteria bacterium]